jgi:hypothetical protein
MQGIGNGHRITHPGRDFIRGVASVCFPGSWGDGVMGDGAFPDLPVTRYGNVQDERSATRTMYSRGCSVVPPLPMPVRMRSAFPKRPPDGKILSIQKPDLVSLKTMSRKPERIHHREIPGIGKASSAISITPIPHYPNTPFQPKRAAACQYGRTSAESPDRGTNWQAIFRWSVPQHLPQRCVTRFWRIGAVFAFSPQSLGDRCFHRRPRRLRPPYILLRSRVTGRHLEIRHGEENRNP